MPKDADMNCGENKGTPPVNTYAHTLSACGAIDMWGNVWERTSASPQTGDQKTKSVKGGARSTPRTACRIEYRDEDRNTSMGYDTVGFRLIREN